MMTRKEFLEEVMKIANLKDLKQADDATRAVISLTKLIIETKLSQKIAKISPPDLRKGWESYRAAFRKKRLRLLQALGVKFRCTGNCTLCSKIPGGRCLN